MRAIGVIKGRVRGGVHVFEAVYWQSYRHAGYRVASSDPGQMWPSQDAADAALKERAQRDGVEIAIEVQDVHAKRAAAILARRAAAPLHGGTCTCPDCEGVS